MIERLTGEQEIQRQFHQDAFAAEQHYVEVLKQRIAVADRGEFASVNDVEAFFSEHVE